jgi:hypothetical protein
VGLGVLDTGAAAGAVVRIFFSFNIPLIDALEASA